ncbi:amino acid ABC transporter permease, partial [bacterium]|nr:amino acid ABC transporter permease [bacterium]
MRGIAALTAFVLLSTGVARGREADVVVASKKFTESVVLGELLTVLAGTVDARAEHRRELGGTRIVWNALLRGEIDAYVEYTGTLRQEIFSGEDLPTAEALREALAAHGLVASRPLGFNNTYALGMLKARAAELGVTKISDLVDHPELSLAFTNEFLDRGDGWPALQRAYGLPHGNVRGIDHDLAYRALEAGSIDAMDMYSTDAEIGYYDLETLRDDREHFPEYEAIILWREDLAERDPGIVAAFRLLEGELDEDAMVALNARVKIDRVPERIVAADFVRDRLELDVGAFRAAPHGDFPRRTREHLALVGVSLAAAVLVSIPLGIVAAKRDRLGQVILGVTGVIQTIP